MRDGAYGIRRITMELSGNGMGGVRSDWIRGLQAGGGGCAIWECGDPHGFAAILRIDFDFAATVDPVWKTRKNQLKSRGADLNDGVGCTSLKG